MFEERSQQRRLTSRSSERRGHRSAQGVDVVGNEVDQSGVLGAVPHLFVGVEVRGVGRQPLDPDPMTEAGLQAFGGAAMDLVTIHDSGDRSSQPPQHVSNELLEVVGDDVVVEDVEVHPQPAAGRPDGGGRDRRQTIGPISTVVRGRLTRRSPTASDGRLEHEAGLIGKYKASAALSRVFLYAASPVDATERWPARFARVRDAGASGNSSPCAATHARRPTGRRSRRSACGSPAPHASTSTTPSRSRDGSAPATGVCPAARPDGHSTWAWDRGGAWPTAPLRRRRVGPWPIGRRLPALRPGCEPPRTATIPDPAARSPATDAAPLPCARVSCSYRVRSAGSGWLSELFKGQKIREGGWGDMRGRLGGVL